MKGWIIFCRAKIFMEGNVISHIRSSLISLLTFMDCKTIQRGISIFFSRNSIAKKRV